MERPYSSAYDEEVVIPQVIEPSALHTSGKNTFGGLSTDDIILIAVILLLLSGGETDKITIAVLAFLFISGTDLFKL